MHNAADIRLIIIGGGTMGLALAVAATKSGVLKPAQILICESDLSRHAGLAGLVGAVVPGVAALPQVPDIAQVLLAVKPQAFAAVANEYAPLFEEGPGRRRVVISIMAGIPTAVLEARLGKGVAVVRAMPNTPARIGKGITALSLGRSARREDTALATKLFAACGDAMDGVVEIDERLMDAFTALAGSGPAYVFLLAEAMTTAAVNLGFSPLEAERIVKRVVEGSAGLLLASAQGPGALRAAVTSKGGTTEVALAVLKTHKFAEGLVEAIKAGAVRAGELGVQR